MSKQSRIQGAIVVARVSSDEQVDGTSLDTQIAAGRKKAEQLGLPVVAEFREEGRSGAYLLLRQEMNEAIGLIQSGGASHLITMNLTRFARDSKGSQDIKRLVETAGGTLVFTDWEYIKSATGNAQFGMMSTFSQWEREQIIERTTRERRNLALKGIQPSRTFRPFGYLVVSKNHVIDSAYPYTSEDLGKYVVVETEAQWIREMFNRYASSSSIREICRFLQDSGVATPREGAYWRPSTLTRIFRNPVYKGLAPFGRHENVYDERRIEQGFKLVTKRLRPKSEWVYIPCPALVPAEVWEACQARLAEAQARTSGNPKHRHLLSGLLRCPLCKRGMHGSKRERIMKGKPVTENLYNCPDQRASRNPGGVVCNKKLYNGQQAETFVTRAILDIAGGPEIVAAAIKAYRQALGVGYSEAECKRLQEELVGLERREVSTAKAQIEAIEVGASTAIYVQLLKEIAGKKANLKGKIDDLCAKREQSQERGVDEDSEIVAATLRDIEQALTSSFLTDGEKHDLLARVIEEIIPDEDGDGYKIKLKPFAGVGTVANILLVGPPGSGKTMLARRIPSILPPLSLEESLDVTKIYSVGGLLGTQTSLVSQRPFRSPHHSISNAALAGGGSVPRPGEVSLSHHGILFLDELPEFKRDVLEVLRQPLEDGHVTIARVAGTMTYPAQLMLVAAMNPCPCGYFGDTVKTCACSASTIAKYLQRISGPLLDRIDIHIEVPRLRQDEMIHGGQPGEPSASIRRRVMDARQRQAERFTGTALHSNSHMGARQIKEHCRVGDDVKDLLRAAITQLGLSARAYDRILKLARTIADLDAAPDIQLAHVAEAIQYRALDRKLWG